MLEVKHIVEFLLNSCKEVNLLSAVVSPRIDTPASLIATKEL